MRTDFIISEGKLCAFEGDGTVQVFITPTSEEKSLLTDAFGIDIHNLDSALDNDEVSRIENDEGALAIFFKRPKNYISSDRLLFQVVNMGLFIFPDKLIAILPDDAPLLEEKYNNRIKDLTDALLRILGSITNHFLSHLKIINMLSDSLENKLTTTLDNHYLLNLFTLEKSLVFFLNGISGNGLVLKRLSNISSRLSFHEDQSDLLEDIIIENQQSLKQAEISSDIHTSMMDARGSIISNNQNQLIKKLTVINVVFMPLNLIAAIGGMSEYTNFTAQIPWPISYSFFGLGLVFLGFMTYNILKFTGREPARVRGRQSGKNPRIQW